MRHNAIQYDLMQLGQYGAKRVIDSGLGRIIEEDGRKGDLLFGGMGTNNTDLVVDITLANALTRAYLPQSAHVQNYALSLLEHNKIVKYAAAYRNVGVDFKPLALEMHGATSATFTKFLKELTSAAAKENDIPYGIMYSYWQRRISTTLQKYNAKVLQSANNKIAHATGQMRDGDLDLNDHVLNERHIHNM